MIVKTVLAGLLLGFFSTLPIAGPLAILVFVRGVERRLRSALMIGLGGTLAESCYVLLASLGASALPFVGKLSLTVSRTIAALLLIGMGAWLMRARKVGSEANIARGHAGSFALGFSITIINPILLVSWTAISTVLLSLNIIEATVSPAIALVASFVLGKMAGFGTLLLCIARYRDRFSMGTLARAVRVLGILLLVLGLGTLGRAYL